MKNRYLFILFAAVFIKFIPIGLKYRPLQDDYIQYYAYSRYDDVYADVIKRIGLLNVRPLAGIADIYLWGRFWGNMTVVLLIINILYLLSYLLFKYVFRQMGIDTGAGFALTYLLCPIGFEAAYWISASSRIIVSMFFVSLMLYARLRDNYFLFLPSLILSMGFYEQTAFLGAVMSVWVNAESVGRGYKVKKYALSCVCVWLAVLTYYICFSGKGSFGARSSISFANPVGVFIAVTDAWKSIWSLFEGGFTVGTSLLLLSAVTALGITYFGTEVRGSTNAKKLYIGILLFISSYVVHIPVGSAFIPYRCHMPALPGLGLVVDFLLEKTVLKNAAVFILAFVFINANMYQAQCCGKINEYDIIICRDILRKIENKDKKEDIFIGGVKRLYIDVPEMYGKYILPNVTESDWALTGAVRAMGEDLEIKRIIPDCGG